MQIVISNYSNAKINEMERNPITGNVNYKNGYCGKHLENNYNNNYNNNSVHIQANYIWAVK